MLLDDCPDGTSLFVDASLLYLHFVDTPSLPERAASAAALSREQGLLTGDALVAAVMRRLGLTHLATNDYDFERVSWLSCYPPR